MLEHSLLALQFCPFARPLELDEDDEDVELTAEEDDEELEDDDVTLAEVELAVDAVLDDEDMPPAPVEATLLVVVAPPPLVTVAEVPLDVSVNELVEEPGPGPGPVTLCEDPLAPPVLKTLVPFA